MALVTRQASSPSLHALLDADLPRCQEACAVYLEQLKLDLASADKNTRERAREHFVLVFGRQEQSGVGGGQRGPVLVHETLATRVVK